MRRAAAAVAITGAAVAACAAPASAACYGYGGYGYGNYGGQEWGWEWGHFDSHCAPATPPPAGVASPPPAPAFVPNSPPAGVASPPPSASPAFEPNFPPAGVASPPPSPADVASPPPAAGYGDKPTDSYGGYAEDGGYGKDVCTCTVDKIGTDNKHGINPYTGEACECPVEGESPIKAPPAPATKAPPTPAAPATKASPPPPLVLKVLETTTTFPVADIDIVDLAAFKESVVASVTESAGGASVVAILIVRITATYTLPLNVECVAVVEAYAIGISIDVSLVSSDCVNARRALLQDSQPITFIVDIPEEQGGLARTVGNTDVGDVAASMASTLEVDESSVTPPAEQPSIDIVVDIVAQVFDEDTANLDLDDLTAAITEDLTETVQEDFGTTSVSGIGVPVVAPVQDSTPPPASSPPPPPTQTQTPPTEEDDSPTPPATEDDDGPTPPATEDDDGSDPPIGAIVGGTVGGVVALGVGGYFAVKYCKRSD